MMEDEMHENTWNIIIVICIIFRCIQVNAAENKVNTEVFNNEVVFTIGNVSITDYELAKNIMNCRNAKKENIRVTRDSIKVWIDNYIDRMIIVAKAYDNNYNIRNDILKDVENAEFMVLLNEYKNFLFLSNNPTYNFALLDTINYCEVIKILDIPECEEIIQSITKENFDMYYKTKEIILKESNRQAIHWPYGKFAPYVSMIRKLDIQDVSIPLKIEKDVYYIKLLKTEIVESNYDYSKVNDLIQYLEYEKKSSAYISKVITDAEIRINYQNVLQLYKILFANGSIASVDLEQYDDSIREMNILSYKNNGILKTMNVASILDYYEKTIKHSSLTFYEFINLIIRNVVDSKMYEEAVASGWDERTYFVLDRINYINTVIFNKYIQENYLMENKIVSPDFINAIANDIRDNYHIYNNIDYNKYLAYFGD